MNPTIPNNCFAGEFASKTNWFVSFFLFKNTFYFFCIEVNIDIYPLNTITQLTVEILNIQCVKYNLAILTPIVQHVKYIHTI